MSLHQIGHMLVCGGFWLSGIAIGFLAARRETPKRTPVDLAVTLGGVDLGPWIEKSRETR